MLLQSGALLLALSAVTSATASSKRGLVFVPNAQWPDDYKVWVQSGSDLTWYYNYGSTPSSVFSGVSQDKFEFVPMLWGAISDTSFLTSVERQIANGVNITHVLGFNEPNGPASSGGSNITPLTAAQIWVKNMEPLAAKGVKLGLPACTGGTDGLPWLQQFLGNCSTVLSAGSTTTKNCTYDFVNLHWYGDFTGLASHMGQYSAAFPNVPQWITEYNFDNQDLTTSQSFFNTSAEYFDRMSSVDRYSFFGSFRSKVSNVGSNAVMLSNDGKLTDIGSWYLGGSATGVLPQSQSGATQRQSSVVLAVAAAAVVGFAGISH